MQSHPEPASHYENFPVASLLLPAYLRASVRVIYAFARSADDLADEGNAEPQARIDALNAYEDELNRIEQARPPLTPLFAALAPVLATHAIPLQLLRDLLSAFRQDVVRTRYPSVEMLLDYCRRSANPVGRIMLCLYREQSPEALQQSDAICTALQLINFWQDVAIDWQKARIYLPGEDRQRFKVSEEQIARGHVDDHWRALMQFEIQRARALMQSGAPLARRLPGRAGWELRLVVLGGFRILEKIEAADYDVFRRRPRLDKADWARMLWRAVRFVG